MTKNLPSETIIICIEGHLIAGSKWCGCGLEDFWWSMPRFANYFSLPSENADPFPCFCPHLHRQYADNGILCPRPGFYRPPKNCHGYQCWNCSNQPVFMMVGRWWHRIQGPLQPLHPFKAPFNPTPSFAPRVWYWAKDPLAVILEISWKLMLRQLKAVCFYLSVLFSEGQCPAVD